MSQKTWIRGPICGVGNCRSRLWTSNAGHQMCQYGHVMEGDIEMNDEAEDNFTVTRRLNIQISETGTAIGLQSQQASLHLSIGRRVYGKNARTVYLHCLQILLKKQIKIFVNNLMPDNVELEKRLLELCKLYWIRLLRANPESIKIPINIDLVSLIYLAMIQLNDLPIYTPEILDYIKHNKIPYTKCIHLIPKALLDKLPAGYFHCLEPPRLPSNEEIYERILVNLRKVAKTKASSISINFYFSFIFTVLTDVLIIPNAPEMFLMINELLLHVKITHLYMNYDPQLTLMKKLVDFPEIKIASIIVFTIKLYFMYDITSLPKINYSRWLSTLEKYEMKSEIPFLHLDSASELISASDAKVSQYCQWLYDSLVPKKNKSIDSLIGSDTERNDLDEDHGELSVMQKRLFQIFSIDSFNDSGSSPESDEVSSGSQFSDFMTKVAANSLKKPSSRPVRLSDILYIESQLFEKLSKYLNVSTNVLEKALANFESEIKSSTKNVPFDKINTKVSTDSPTPQPRSLSPTPVSTP